MTALRPFLLACLLAPLAGCGLLERPLAVADAPAVVRGQAPVLAAGLAQRPASATGRVASAAWRELEHDSDLYGLALRLRAHADGGDVQASWQLSRIHEYCAGYAADPARYAQVGPPGVGVAAARARISRRCGGFAPGDGLGREQVLARRQQAALAGNLAAEASLLGLGQPLFDDAEYRRDLVERVLAEGEGEALYALAPAMGRRAARDPAMNGLMAGELEHELAWRLAACELGKDCGPGSMAMDSYCAHGGICASQAGDHLMDLVQQDAHKRGVTSDPATLLMQQLLEARRKAWR